MIDPRLRQRVEVVPVRTLILPGVSNAELVEGFRRASEGKLADAVVRSYCSLLRDPIAFFRTQEGREIPVREWTKEGMWGYLHFIEANYCANLGTAPRQPGVATCREKVWLGGLAGDLAVQTHCAGCPLFRRGDMRLRIRAIARWFKYLARIGAVPTNFMRDVVSEWNDENGTAKDNVERRRNPTVEEQVQLVNRTRHPQRRAFYAASAKWWFRLNEMLALDRYASFGMTPPEGVRVPPGFENGFAAHPEVLPFDQGGDMVYLPEKRNAKGEPVSDKRKGNRWSVIDSELRPIIEALFEWWEATVRRDAQGRPLTTSLWLTPTGLPQTQDEFYDRFFKDDAERLGLLTPEERNDPRRAWTNHCQRHFGEKVLEMANTPDNWCNHFRGDALRDARKHYFKPEPLQVRQKYHEFVPLFGFAPVAEAAA